MRKHLHHLNHTIKIGHWFCAALISIALFQSGCASCKIPAIDPSGVRIFQPGGTQLLTPCATKRQQAAQPVAVNPVFQPVPFTPPPVAMPQQAVAQGPVQPAFQHPATPPPCNTPVVGKSKKKTYVPRVTGRKSPGESGQIIITPSRIVAPVGSEVVVLAGICGDDGYFVKNQPLEWMLSNNSVGDLIEVGGQHHKTFNQLIPPTSKKFSGQYAQGRTGLKRLVLTRGTPTPMDDIELAKGQTFVSVASASPGTSYVTAVAPKAEGWDKRRASTTIHWVDGQWAVPAPTRATAGTVHPLTTVVSRTDGTGVKGWETKYTIVGGAKAEFAPTGSQTASATTDNEGQATVQIRQPAGQFEPGTTRVRVDIVRPPIFGEPELVVESGITSVTWSAPALTIRAIGPRKSEIGEPFNFRVEVTNPGDQIARGVVVRTKNLDDGIDFISSTPKTTEYGRQLEWQIGDVAPGSGPKVISVQLKSKKQGNVGMCFEVASQTDRLQTEACAETEIIRPCIGFSMQGPTTATVGERIQFTLAVENRCEEQLENVEIIVNYDPGLLRPGKSNPARFNNPLLQVGENQSLPEPLDFIAQTPGTHCLNIEVRARGVQPQFQRRCVVVTAASGAGGAGGGTTTGSTIELELRTTTSSAGKPLVEALIVNRGTEPLDNVALINRTSESLEPAEITLDYRDRSKFYADELLVDLGRLNPGEPVKIEITYAVLADDANALSEITVSHASGASATKSVPVPLGPNGGSGGNQPGGDPVGIPGDDTPVSQGTLSVDVRTLDPKNITLGQQSKVEFVVTNNSSQPFRNVDIRILVPNSVEFVNFVGNNNRLKLVEQYRIERINDLRAGEALAWTITLQGRIAGQARVEVQAKSDDTAGLAAGSDVIEIR